MKTFKEKMAEHEKLFPLADLRGQILKLEEELKEVDAAKNKVEAIQELADCIICCIGICRFAPKTATFIIKSIMMQHDFYLDEICNEVERKWEINLNRKWEYKNGRYHHIKELN
jgi:hypothetical protein